MEGRGDGSPDNPYVFLEMGPDTISVNSISAQVVTSDDEDHDLTPPPTQTTSTGTGRYNISIIKVDSNFIEHVSLNVQKQRK